MNDLNDNLPRPTVRCARILVAFWLAGWFLKGEFFRLYLFQTIVGYPFVMDFFPEFFRSAQVAQCFYLLPLFVLTVFIRPYRTYFFLAAVIMTVSSFVLLLHQDTHNDATFLTSFWVGLWLIWFSTQMHRDDDDFFVHARSLALCVVGLNFLGGFVGKLTPEFWNGKALADIFMEQNYGVIGSRIRAAFSEHDLRTYFQWISKAVVVGEGMLALSPILPYRLVVWVGIPFMAGISLFTTWRIFSVLFCLIGLLIAVGRLKK